LNYEFSITNYELPHRWLSAGSAGRLFIYSKMGEGRSNRQLRIINFERQMRC